MRSIRVVAWQFLARHKGFFASMLATQLSLAMAIVILGAAAIPDAVFFIAVAFTSGQMIYLLAVFGFGCDSDLLDPTTTYPTHMLSLPADTRWLACIPFLIGSAFVVALLCFTDWFVFEPARSQERFQSLGIPPLKWSVFFVSLLAWLQAILWASYRSASWRAALLLVVLILPVAWIRGLIVRDLSDSLAIYVLLGSIPVALCIACKNLALARSGVVGGIDSSFLRLLPIPSRRSSRGRQESNLVSARSTPKVKTRRPGYYETQLRRGIQTLFRFPVSNQVWMEWRCNCVPILVVQFSLLMFFGVLSLSWPFFEGARQMMLISPMFVAAIGGIGMGNLSQGNEATVVPAFYSSRPFSSLGFVGSKWIASLLTAATLVVASIVSFAIFSLVAGSVSGVGPAWELARERFPSAHLVFGLVSGTFGYVLVIWTLLVQLFPVTMTGRSWVQTLVIGSVLLVALAFVTSVTVENSPLLPWTLAAMFAFKTLLGGFSVIRLRNLELLDEGATFQVIVVWLGLLFFFSLVVYGFVAPFAGFASLIVILPIGYLLMPFSRLLLAPIALHVNRHR